jgi:bile-salt sulfotransferase
LHLKLDWAGSPGFKSREKMTTIEHWLRHVDGWHKLAKKNDNIMILRYEGIVDHPYATYLKIHDKFFSNATALLDENDVNPISKPVGLLPNEGTKDSWKSAFTEEDEKLFVSKVNRKGFYPDI